MLRKSLVPFIKPLYLLPHDKRACMWITNYVIIQCVVVFIGASSILLCIWSPKHSTLDFDKLARIMYLYDPRACRYCLHSSGVISNVQLSNETYGLNVLPIQWMPAIAKVSTRLSAKTRRYTHMTIAVHIIWMISAIILQIFKSTKRTTALKIVLSLFLYTCVFVILFDISMAIVYVAHIQQSLTKGMILRYSGWSVEMQIENYDDFGGWLPMIASACWLRGVVFLALNVYCCRLIRLMLKRIQKREVKTRLMLTENGPIPEARYNEPKDHTVLYYRSGEYTPVTTKSFW